jgi:hypothetical protein
MIPVGYSLSKSIGLFYLSSCESVSKTKLFIIPPGGDDREMSLTASVFQFGGYAIETAHLISDVGLTRRQLLTISGLH